MSTRTRSELLADLEDLRASQVALADRLGRIMTAMALSQEVTADVHQRLDALDDQPNGHRDAAAIAAETAHTYRQFLSDLADRVDNP